ncbi:hypothetical protein [Octadecabacter antarcticus]|nr:hypothetical protein [Octadecabacter antarcticus]
MKNVVAAAAVCVAGSAAVAQDIAYELNNNSGYTVMYVYTSPSNADYWGDDILGAQVLASGYMTTVYIHDDSDQCDYDIKFVFDDGDELTDQIDICDLGSYTIN